MVFRANRRWLYLFTALLFTISSVAHVYAMTDAAMKMPSTSMESSMSDHGMDCGGGDDKAAKAACIAMCATAVAILNEPAAIPLSVVMHNVVAAPELPPPSLGRSPEPHPPKR
jgi:hypothetical protein